MRDAFLEVVVERGFCDGKWKVAQEETCDALWIIFARLVFLLTLIGHYMVFVFQ